MCGSQQTGKFSKIWEYRTTLPLSWETCMQAKKQQLEQDMEQLTGSKLGKEYDKAVILSPCLFKLYAEYIMRNEAGWITNWNRDCHKNVNNLRYPDDTTLMAEIEEEVKRLLMRVIGESKIAGLKLNIQKMKIKWFRPIVSWEIEWRKVKAVTSFILGGSKITADGDCSHEIQDACSLEGKQRQT